MNSVQWLILEIDDISGIVDYMISIRNTQRKTAEKFATFLVQMYPNTFCDKIGGNKIGQGMEGL